MNNEQACTNDTFIEWLKTPLGCDGGNINGNIWFFGIEYGGGEKDLAWILRDKVDYEHGFVDDEYRANFPNDYQYNTKLTKLYAAMLGQPISRYEDVFSLTHMFGNEHGEQYSDTYKGNIFTLSFPEDKEKHFNEKFQEATGCNTKEQYKQLHRQHRFPMLRSWVKEHRPKVIVAFGSSNHYVMDYIRAFEHEDADRTRLTYEAVGDVGVSWGLVNEGKTLLVVVPFLGYYAHCLNSDIRLRHVGRAIRRLAQQHFGKDWCHYANLRLPAASRLAHDTVRPKHPGFYLKQEIKQTGLSDEVAAQHLQISLEELQDVYSGKNKINPTLAHRLALATSSSIESWLEKQMAVDVWDELQQKPPEVASW